MESSREELISIDSFPDELLLAIFQHARFSKIPLLALTNQKFHRIILSIFRDNAFWKLRYEQHHSYQFRWYMNRKKINWLTQFKETHQEAYKPIKQATTKKLFILVKEEDFDSLQELTISFANLLEADGNGMTLIQWAAIKKNQPILDHFYKIIKKFNAECRKNKTDIATKNSEEFTLLHLATICNQLSTVRALIEELDEDIEVTTKGGETALYLAAQNGHLGVVQYLAEHGANIDTARNSGATPLFIAAEEGHLEVVQFLAEHGANVNTARNSGATPLFIAAQQGHLEIIQFLVEHGANVNAARNDGTTPLFIAAEEGHLGVVQYLAEHGANVNAARDNGATPLFIAAQQNYFEVLQYLAEHGANIDTARNDGVTPLFIAAKISHLEIVQFLTEHGANVNAAFINGDTPLYIAAEQGHLEVLQYLAEHGAMVNAARNSGATPLYIAAEQGHLGIIKYLIDHGADINAAINRGKEKNQNKIVEMLTNEIKATLAPLFCCKKINFADEKINTQAIKIILELVISRMRNYLKEIQDNESKRKKSYFPSWSSLYLSKDKIDKNQKIAQAYLDSLNNSPDNWHQFALLYALLVNNEIDELRTQVFEQFKQNANEHLTLTQGIKVVGRITSLLAKRENISVKEVQEKVLAINQAINTGMPLDKLLKPSQSI